MAIIRYFSDLKDDKYRMKTCFHNGNVRFFPFICEIGVSGFTLPLSVKLVNSGHFNNAAKQLTKEKVIIDH